MMEDIIAPCRYEQSLVGLKTFTGIKTIPTFYSVVLTTKSRIYVSSVYCGQISSINDTRHPQVELVGRYY